MASTNNVITDETTKTVTIRQEAYTLDQGTFREGYHHIIYATTVNVNKGFVNPGCDLTVYCARLVVDSTSGKIDVSGKNGKGFSEGDRWTPIPSRAGPMTVETVGTVTTANRERTEVKLKSTRPAFLEARWK
jgi:hypothetical protein